MKVSYNWLTEYVSDKLPPVEVVVDALTMHSFEIESVEDMGDDKILDVKVLPNRAHDCLSHYGVAMELASVLGLSRNFLLPNQPIPDSKSIKLTISTKSCGRALMVLIKDVKVGQSPKWLIEKLKLLGYKSINSAVDITNYLTYSYGQPMHVFDADKISKNKKGQYEINIRDAVEGERITLLNGVEYALDNSTMVIADSRRALDVAGVMGGNDSSVTEDTKNIILSLSHFDAVSVRKTSKVLGIRTDASVRFENDISPSLVSRSLPYALKLMAESCGGVIEGVVDIYPNPQKEKTILVTAEKIGNVLGVKIDTPTIIFLLQKQQIKAVKNEDDILERFIATIKKNGDWGIRRKIFNAAEVEIVKKRGGRIFVAEFAREFPAPEFFKTLSAEDRFKKIINPKLVAGVRVTIDGSRTADFSFESKLRKLFTPSERS